MSYSMFCLESRNWKINTKSKGGSPEPKNKREKNFGWFILGNFKMLQHNQTKALKTEIRAELEMKYTSFWVLTKGNTNECP